MEEEQRHVDIIPADYHTCFFGAVCEKGIRPIQNWADTLQFDEPANVPCVGVLYKDLNADEEKMLALSINDARSLWVEIIKALAQSGDPVAERLEKTITEVLDIERKEHEKKDKP